MACTDMSGNVYDWCWDLYSRSYYSRSPSTDPRGPPSYDLPEYHYRVQRGGGYYDLPNGCRTAHRNAFWNHDIGFRCVRAPSQTPSDMALIPAGSFTMGDIFSEGDSE